MAQHTSPSMVNDARFIESIDFRCASGKIVYSFNSI